MRNSVWHLMRQHLMAVLLLLLINIPLMAAAHGKRVHQELQQAHWLLVLCQLTAQQHLTMVQHTVCKSEP
jgi:hypothetical protein